MKPEDEDASRKMRPVSHRQRRPWSPPRLILSANARRAEANFPHPLDEGPPTFSEES